MALMKELFEQGMGRRYQTVMSMDIIYYTTGRQLLGHCIFKPDGGTVHPIANSYSTYGVIVFACGL